MNRRVGFLLLILPCWVLAAEGVRLDEVDIDVSDRASLSRGAELFSSYCQGCHSIKHLRYSRLAADFAVPEKEVQQTLVPAGGSLYDGMSTAMSGSDAERWFAGAKSPDLSLIARSRSPEWLYTYLRSFYLDEARPFGVNNAVFPDVAMPNVFWELQGRQEAVFQEQAKGGGLARLRLVKAGQMTPQEFDAAMADLVNFLVFAGEPAQRERIALGKYVLLFLLVFLVLAYLLKKEFWKDVH